MIQYKVNGTDKKYQVEAGTRTFRISQQVRIRRSIGALSITVLQKAVTKRRLLTILIRENYIRPHKANIE